MSILDEYLELARESIKTIEERFQGYPIEWKLAIFDKLVRPYYYFEIEKKQNIPQKPNAMATVENIPKVKLKNEIIELIKTLEKLDNKLDREISDKIEKFILDKKKEGLDDLSEMEISELYRLLNGALDQYYSLHSEKMTFDVKVEKIKDFVKNKLNLTVQIEPFPKERKIVVGHIDKNAFDEFKTYVQNLNFTRVLNGYDSNQNSAWRLNENGK